MGSATEALRLIETIRPAVNFFKVGMELYAAAGREFVAQLTSLGANVFLDLKLYDIAETVQRSTRQICKQGPVSFLTVHGSGAIMRAAVEGRGEGSTKLLGVTVLTSFDQQDLADLGYPATVSELVELRVRKAVESRIDGVVCSPVDVARVREIGGPNLIIVAPGVRSAGAALGDQKRVGTPAQAIRDGADYLVIGRQVTRAVDPAEECSKVLDEIATSEFV